MKSAFYSAIFWIVVCVAVLLVGTAVKKVYGADNCPTLQEARKQYPTAHLYKTHGCWGVGKPRSVERRPNVMKRDREMLTRVAMNDPALDANGMYQSEIEPPQKQMAEAFNPQEPFQLFIIAAEKKPERVIAPMIVESEPIVETKPPPAKPQLWAWLVLLACMFLLATGSAFVISRLSINRRGHHAKPSSIARSAFKPSPSGQRTIARSDGARNQQSHFHSRDILEWSGGAYERGHADYLDAIGNRRDDSGALGAWARSRGLRPETPIESILDPGRFSASLAEWNRTYTANKPKCFGWFRKRIAAWR